ncbi:hypothetical protein NEFER03_1382 [Nematocida sp. LUAm3]|nr:hypothetical protein NEFER03_1382 [Nematocida sp. LUAm3]KAI5174788.1 hypothetical protein NEFER02_0898 [Nematocida sp. LUAm2]KAI5177801.1 hypothetical protein NEFER01_1003 [Nematocida sp. LUAm1]
MEDEWLVRKCASLCERIGIKEKQIQGVLIGGKQKKEWRFTASIDAKVKDLCRELEKQSKERNILLSRPAEEEKICELKKELYLVRSNRQILYIERESVTISLGDKKRKEKEKGASVVLKRVGTRQRTCNLCKNNVARYRKKKDSFMPADVKQLCTSCYEEFHWSKSGKRLYDEFLYEENM